MSDIRRRYTSHFTVLGNTVFEDDRLKADELGIICYLRSRPDNWQIRRPHLGRRFGIGRLSMRRIIHNLVQYGHLVAQGKRLDDGKLYWWYEIRDEAGPELTPEEVKASLSMPIDDSDDEAIESEDAGGDQRVTADGRPQATPRLYIDSLNTELTKTNPPKRVRARIDFAQVAESWLAKGGGVISRVACEREHLGLSEPEQKVAYETIKQYIADCQNERRKICDLATYYREKRWEKFTALPAKKEHAIFRAHSPQWHRWHEYKIATNQSVAFMESRARTNPESMWTEPTEWPPALPNTKSA